MLRKIPYSLVVVTLLGYSVMPGRFDRQANAASAPVNTGTGVHISFVDEQGNPASQLYVLGNKVRVESSAMRGGGAIYDAHSHSMTILIPERHAYMVLDQKSAAAMGAQLQDAQKQLQSRLSSLPPDQRAMVEKMLTQHGNTDGKTQTTVKQLGSSETIAGHRCQDMQLISNGKPGPTMCVAPLASLGIPAGDIDTLDAMRVDMMHMMSHMGPMTQAYSTMQNVDGFAIKREVPHREGFKLVLGTETLKSISTGNPAASLFEIPADYKETSMQQMMQGKG
ncbi:MAG: DUF4412 domain-containing protein [Gammaproteobacteria bacterium]